MIKILEIVRLSHSVRSRAPVYPVSRPLHALTVHFAAAEGHSGGIRAAVGRGPRPNSPLFDATADIEFQLIFSALMYLNS